MKYHSTRAASPPVSLAQAIVAGLAPDGGLYVPDALPQRRPDDFDGAETLVVVGQRLLEPFFAGDRLERDLPAILGSAMDFEAPCKPLRGTPGPASVLELFHGPTCAFKDFGARFLAQCLPRLPEQDGRPLTILVATSGDTGGAVAAAFHRCPGVDVAVLYPKGLVSERQAHHLACWGDNVRTFAVHGTFDECQQLVKGAFRDPDMVERYRLSSANSINLGRLLPQMVYYARTSLDLWRQHGVRPNFIVPSGNLGNVLACIWAREIGLPIGDIVLATNANLTVTEYLSDGEWRPRRSVATLASAMDVGDPSNRERLRFMFPAIERLRSAISARSVSDQEIRETIVRDAEELGEIWCPHTATAAHVYRQLAGDRAGEHWVLVATAHPAKFNDIVEPLIGREVPVPPELARLLARPRIEQEIGPDLGELRRGLARA
ncbi:MAG TPA: threonine synthase [Steroidobacteraceae bacterium]|nr:threonine synthase [Steroidobacteraceae bacterium]